MRRFLAGLVTALALWAAGPVWFTADAYVRTYRTRVVRCTDTARSLFSSGVRRSQVRVMNLGTATVFVGETGGTLTVALGWPIHAGALAANILLTDTQAGMDCIVSGVDTVEVGVMEELE